MDSTMGKVDSSGPADEMGYTCGWNTRSKKTSECPIQSLPLHSVYDLWIQWNARLYQKRANRMENLLHELKTTVYIRV
ncbi:hypothetical protein MTR67_031887 [Solanum verrucosum]|uniref:Uncharacterized protein n=1 Tax=Solanum verrucosum TaxID=315347 RepID=A0AAF0U3E5_SOLVR|nr:hypothetical protein MTR67_031887 [Solanum verrucosum]